MKLIGLMMARNEDWILGFTARAALRWVDELVLLDHVSTDETPRIIEEVSKEYAGRVHAYRVSDPMWREMQYRQTMLEAGRDFGGTHFALIDADEILTANLLGRIRAQCEQLPPAGLMMLWMPCLWRSIARYRCDSSSPWSKMWASSVVRDAVGIRWEARNGYDYHHRHPIGTIPNKIKPFGQEGGLMHLQFVDWRRMRAKHVLYKMSERVRWPGRDPVEKIEARYNLASNENGLQVAPVPDSWWRGYEDIMQHGFRHTMPWQIEECRKLMAQYGIKYFQGLDLFGMCGKVKA